MYKKNRYQQAADLEMTRWEHGGPRTYRQNRQPSQQRPGKSDVKVKGTRLTNDFNVARKGFVGFLRKLMK